jgi:WD40-like Beta Propeller Repeat
MNHIHKRQAMNKLLIIVSVLIPCFSYTQILRLDEPPPTPAIFEEGLISTSYSERDFALSPDGTEIFYTLQSPQAALQTIVYMKKDKKGNWTKPEVAPFAGQYSDLEPAFSPDGMKLFFSSNRPLNGVAIKDFDIWCVEKKNGEWGQPKNIGEPVNTMADEYYPSITATGNLYFTAAHKNGVGKEDIWLAKWNNGKYETAMALDTNVNSTTYEFNAFVSPDETFIIFSSYGRKDDKGGSDLYMSVKDAAGKWQPAKNLLFLNSDRIDYCPFVSFDKKILFFTSERSGLKKSFPGKPASYAELTQLFSSTLNGGGNIYWVSFERVMEMFK